MERTRGIFRNPVALIGMGFATFALALFVAGLVTGGFSLAQEGTPTATAGATTSPEATPSGDTDTGKDARRDQYLDTLAGNLGVSREALDEALKQTGLDMVDQALADGKITEEEAANIRQRIESGDGFFFGPFGHGHHGHGPHFGFGYELGDVADFLGITQANLRTALQDGQSLTQLAEANGKTRDELKAYLVSEVQDQLDQAVENGRITQDEADTKLANATEHIDTLIDREGLPDRPWGPGRMPHDLDSEDGDAPGGLMFDPGQF